MQTPTPPVTPPVRSVASTSTTPARRLLLLVLLLVLTIGLVAPSAHASRVSDTTATDTADSLVATTVAFDSVAYRRGIARHTRRTRAAHGVGSVGWNGCLNVAAREWATKLARTNSFHHQNLSAVLQRCHLRAVGENLALGYSWSPGTIRAWMNSPGHRANLLRSRYNRIGVGAARGPRGLVTVQLLGQA